MLDVRTPEEHAEGHIQGTDFNIDMLSEGFTAEALAVLPKDRGVALYCRSGNRSKRAAQILAENGYTVVELAVGYKEFLNQLFRIFLDYKLLILFDYCLYFQL